VAPARAICHAGVFLLHTGGVDVACRPCRVMSDPSRPNETSLGKVTSVILCRAIVRCA
jgi:hypothetical protein